MSYTPINQRKGDAKKKSTNYTPIAQRRQPEPPGLRIVPNPIESSDIRTSLSTSATPTGPDTKEIARSFAQGIGRGYLATGQAIVSGDNTTPLVHQGEDTFLGQLTRRISGTDQPISLAQEDLDLLGEDLGAKTGGILSVALTSLDLFGGGGLRGVAGLSKALKSAETVTETSRLMRGAGFSDDIIEQYAPIFARSGDQDEITKGLVAAERLQQTTAKYTPVSQRTTTGRQTKAVIKANTEGPAPASITKPEDILLRSRIRDQARGARAGYRAGYGEAREAITAKLRTTTENADRVRSSIVDFVKLTIPSAEQGKFMTMVKNAKTQRDLTRAFTRIDAKAKQYVLRDAIRTLRSTAESLSDSPSVSVDYRTKIEDLIGQYELQGHTNATIARLEGTQAFLNRMEAAGEDVELPRRILDRLAILTRTPKDQLTLPQVQTLQSEIELLGHLGRTKWRTKQELYEVEKLARKQQLLQSAMPLNSLKPPARKIGEKPSEWTKRYLAVRNYLQKTRLDWRPVDGFAEITGMLPMKRALDQSFTAYLGRAIPGVDNFAALEKKMLELGEALPVASRERVGVYAHAQQTDGYEKLANLGFTRAEVDEIVLTPDEKAFYNAVQEFNKASFPAVKKYSADVYNVEVGEVENYMSFITDFDEMSDLEIYQRFGGLADEAVNRRTKTVEHGFTKERTGAGNQKVQIDALKVAQRHSDDVAYMLTMGRDIKQYAEIVNSPEMIERLGDLGALTWLQWLDLMARKGGQESAKRLAALDVLRKNLAGGVLAFRLSSALVQLTAFADAAGTLGTEWAFRGATAISTSRKWRDFVMENFPEVRGQVGDDIAFRELDDAFLSKATKVGMKPLVMLDALMRSSAAAGAYEKLARAKGISVDFDKPDPQLIQQAQELVRHSQGSSFFKDQPLGITVSKGTLMNRSLNRAIYQFQSFMLNRWDNIERQIWRMGIKEGNYAKASVAFFWLIVVAAAMEESLRRAGEATLDAITGREREDRPFAADAGLNAVQSVPILGSLMSSMTYQSNPVPIISTAESVIRGVSSALGGNSDNTKARGAVQAAGGVAALTGVPGATQLAQFIRDTIPQSRGGSGTPSHLSF